MDEQQFWTTYFSLVRDLLPPQAFGLAPIKTTPAPAAAATAEASSAREVPASDAQLRGAAGAHLTPSSLRGAVAGDLSVPPASPGDGQEQEEVEGRGEEEDEVSLNDEDLAAGLGGADLDLDLDDDPELAQYLEEAVALGDDDLGSGDLDDDLDDYISSLQEQEEHGSAEEVLTPRDGVEE